MTPATPSEFAPDLLGLLAASLPATGLDDLLSRLAQWWQRATAADEVVVIAGGQQATCAACRNGQLPETSRTDVCLGLEPADPVTRPSSTVSADCPEQFLRLLRDDRAVGTIKIVKSQLPEAPQDWILATALLLEHHLALTERLRDDKLAALAEFAAGAGHEINNPLATILICAQRLQQQTSEPEQRRLLATIGGQALRVRDMIGDVMLFARPPAPQLESIDLSAVVAEVLSRFEEQLSAAGLSVTFDCATAVHVQADPAQLRVVISELIRNSIESQPDGGRIHVDCRAAESDSPEHVVLSVADAGPGLNEIARRHLFDPFYSGRPAGRGLGFGLSKTWRIVDSHKGRIEVAEQPAGGLVVTVHWPVAVN